MRELFQTSVNAGILHWDFDEPNVATIDQNGVLHCQAPGTTRRPVTKRPFGQSQRIGNQTNEMVGSILEAYRTTFPVTDRPPEFSSPILVWQHFNHEWASASGNYSAALASDGERARVALSSGYSVGISELDLNPVATRVPDSIVIDPDRLKPYTPEKSPLPLPPDDVQQKLHEVQSMWMQYQEHGLIVGVDYRNHLIGPRRQFWMMLRYDLANESWSILAESDKP